MTPSLLPAPATRRAGDFIFISTLYPAPVGETGYLGDSAMALQTRDVLSRLSRLLEEEGSGLDRVVRVEVELVDPDDFVEFKHEYARFFPEPPARTTIIVGDTHPVAGARLAVHGVAVAGEAPEPRRILPADLVDPQDAEHAVWAVRADPFVFCSAFPATDFVEGMDAKDTSGFYNEFRARHQALTILDRLETTLQEAGSGIEELVKVQFYEPDLRTFPTVDQEWGRRVGLAPTRSSMGVRGLLVPDADWVVNSMAVVPGTGANKEETRSGIAWHPGDLGKANFSPGIRAGAWLFTAGQFPVPDFAKHAWVGAPESLPYYWSDIEIQTRYTLELLRGQLEANGFGLEDVVDARVYLVDPRADARGFVGAWAESFPDPARRPALSIIPSTQRGGSDGVMIQGPRVEIDLISHRDPTP